MTGPLCIGVDPGTTGAIALVSDVLLEVEDLPMESNGSGGRVQRQLDVRALGDLLRDWSLRHCLLMESVTVAIEKPFAMPGVSASTVACQFETFGALRAVLAWASGDMRLAVPRVWKRCYGLKGGDKAASLECARRLFPAASGLLTLAKHHNRAEAALIAHWGRSNVA